MYFWPNCEGRVIKTLEYKGITGGYSQVGMGNTVLLLHGFLEESSMWETFLPLLEKKCRIIAPDLLGHGQTECLGYVHKMEAQAAWVEHVLNKEEAGTCTVIGHSMGGYVALALAEAFPERVSGLALFHSTALADSPEKKKDRERVIQLVQRNKDVYVRAAIPSLFAQQNMARCSELMEQAIRTATSFPTQGIIANLRGMMQRKDHSELLRKGRFRKLVIHGAEDPVIPQKSIEEQLEGAEQTHLEVISDIGHMGHLEAPEKCFPLLSRFCER